MVHSTFVCKNKVLASTKITGAGFTSGCSDQPTTQVDCVLTSRTVIKAAEE
jgi:hypothetical protein